MKSDRAINGALRSAAALIFLQALLWCAGPAPAYAIQADASSPSPAGDGGAGGTLVPEGDRISDFDARAALAEIYTYRDETWKDAARELDILLSVDAARPLSLESLAKLADIATFLGHARTARDLNRRILSPDEATPRQRARAADRMVTWGDFHRAERIYREYPAEDPDFPKVRAALARLLASSERYEESEEMYRGWLLESPGDPLVLERLALNKRLEKDFDASLSLLERAHSGRPESVLAKAETLFTARRFAAAREAWLSAASASPGAEALTGVAATYCGEGMPEKARPYAEKALALDPARVEARFFRDWALLDDEGHLAGTLEALTSPRQMEQLGGLYARYGRADKAIVCFRAALRKDPEYFPARVALAQALAARRDYDASIVLYREMNADFPGNSKLLIGLARVLGWSRRYEEAIALYGEITRGNPADPVPVKEMARTAVWAKEMDRARGYYDLLLSAPVDRALADDLDRLSRASGDGATAALATAVRRRAEEGSQYRGYEEARDALDKGAVHRPDRRAALEKVLVEHLAAYRIQKEAALEKEAKLLAWNKRFMGALDGYRELTSFKPGNQEALFDLGQVECALGLCGEARGTYRRLLNIDPLHGLAAEALGRGEREDNPALLLSQDFWEEEGRGELARIRRYRTSLGVSIPLFDNYALDLAGNAWVEAPIGRGKNYTAYGHTLAFRGVVNRRLSAAAGWTEKRYTGQGPSARETGYARLSLAVNDYLRLEAGYERADEIYNDFGIRQGGIQSNSYWAAFSLRPKRATLLSGRAGHIRYTDGNQGEFVFLWAGHDFSDHPRVFRVTANGEYRNTRHRDIYLYSGQGELLDIIHPYWTPRDYLAGSVTLEWNHDLSRQFFCGGERHFYVVKTTFGTDTEDNPAARLEIEWRYEFLDNWMISLKGLLHRSREWDATGGRLELRYRF